MTSSRLGGSARSVLDRVLIVIARVMLRAFFRRVEVEGRDRLPTGRPVLVVANHFYGFVDPVMLMHVFGRLPRFLGRSTLWRSWAVRPFLWLVGMIPVHRPEDAADVSANAEAFAACHEALARGALVGIFPEGTTHDDPAIHHVRTGAARIALGARSAGVPGLVVVPTGLVFDDKIALRSGVLGRVGDPIDVDTFATEHGRGHPVDASDQSAVRALTLEIAERLRDVAPDYDDAREAEVLRRAAEVTLQAARGPGPRVSMAERETLARRLARVSESGRQEVADRLAHYQLDLEIAGLRDRQVARRDRTGRLLRRTALTALTLVLLSPLAAIGALWNLVPYWIVGVVGRAVVMPATKGTARLVAALIVFPTAWSVVVYFDPFDGALAGAVVFLLAPVLGLVAVAWSESLVLVYRDWRGWVALTERRALLPGVEASRSAVVAAVARALDEAPVPT